MNQHVRAVSEADFAAWDAFVAGHPFGRAVATSSGMGLWRLNGWTIHLLGLFENNVVTAGLALATKSLARLPWRVARTEALLLDGDDIANSAAALLQAAEAVAREDRCLEIELQFSIPDGLPIRDVRWHEQVPAAVSGLGYRKTTTAFATYLVRIDRDDEELLDSLGSKCRRDVRKGRREEVTVVEHQRAEQLQEFCEQLRWMSLRKGIDPPREHMYEALRPMHKRGHLRLFGAWHHDRVRNLALIDALGIPQYKFGATTPATFEKGVPPTGQPLHFEIMRWLRNHGARYYDLGGSPGPVPVEGHANFTVWRFKYEFGAPYVYMLPYHRKLLKGIGKPILALARRMGKLPA